MLCVEQLLVGLGKQHQWRHSLTRSTYKREGAMFDSENFVNEGRTIKYIRQEYFGCATRPQSINHNHFSFCLALPVTNFLVKRVKRGATSKCIM
jgi:hypothetical protein